MYLLLWLSLYGYQFDKFSLIPYYLTSKLITNEKHFLPFVCALRAERIERIVYTMLQEEERPIATLSARRQVRAACIAHIGACHKYCYWRAEIRVSHAGVIRFSLTAAATPPQREILLFLFRPYSLCSPNAVLPPPSPLFLSFISDVPLFFLPFSRPFWPVVPISWHLFSSLPASYYPPSLSSSLVPLFFALWKSFVPTADAQPFVADDRTKKGA